MFPIWHPVEQHFEHHIRLRNPSMLLPQCKIYPLVQTELRKQIIELLKENKIRVSDSLYEDPILLPKRRTDNYIYALIIMLWIKIQFPTLIPLHILRSYFLGGKVHSTFHIWILGIGNSISLLPRKMHTKQLFLVGMVYLSTLLCHLGSWMPQVYFRG